MNWSVNELGNLEGRIAIVTGSNSGIGFETAKALAKHGAHVVMACRNEVVATAKAKEIIQSFPKAKITVKKCDFSDLNSIKEFAESFNKSFETLDLLINNAGVMGLPKGYSKQGYEITFATNHLGHFALTGYLMEKLEKTADSRVVTLSSLAHKWGTIDFENLNAEKKFSKTKVYSQSKLANLLFHFELSRRLKRANSSVKAVAAHPGWTITNLQSNTPLVRCLNPVFGQMPVDGALPSLAAATLPAAQLGDYFGPSGVRELKGPPKLVNATPLASDKVVSEKLWKVSEELTGVRFLQ